MRSILPAVTSLVLPLAAFTAAVPGASPSSAMSTLMSTADGASPKPPKVEGVRRFDVQRLEVPAGMPDTVAITVQIDGKREVLRLTRTSLRSGNAKLLLDKGNGVLEEAPLPPHRTYRGTVESNGAPIHLTGKEYGILELLSLRKGTTLTKEMFLNHLYGGMDEPELKIIDVFICKLRKKLQAATGGQHYIETVWGRGYVLRNPGDENTAAA